MIYYYTSTSCPFVADYCDGGRVDLICELCTISQIHNITNSEICARCNKCRISKENCNEGLAVSSFIIGIIFCCIGFFATYWCLKAWCMPYPKNPERTVQVTRPEDLQEPDIERPDVVIERHRSPLTRKVWAGRKRGRSEIQDDQETIELEAERRRISSPGLLQQGAKYSDDNSVLV